MHALMSHLQPDSDYTTVNCRRQGFDLLLLCKVLADIAPEAL